MRHFQDPAAARARRHGVPGMKPVRWPPTVGRAFGRLPMTQEFQQFLVFALIGFGAQLIDGALGMAFGVLSTTSLLAFGVPPAVASAMTHSSEIFTTAASGASHLHHRNVEWKLVGRLAPAGMLGGAIGAYGLSSVSAQFMQPVVSAYLAGIGIFIFIKAFRPIWPRSVTDRAVPWIALGGGLLDAMGGGGWGPIVTGSLIGRGHAPRQVIGSANLTEFLVTMTISATFVLTLGWSELSAAAGLTVGGVLAAPLGGFLVSRIPVRPLMAAVGILLFSVSLWRII
jgi:uncharacterized membrane protein YfcA